MNKEKILIKITNYKGAVTESWKAPKTKRQCRYAIEKLLKLYHRCKKTNLLTKDLLTAIKKYAEALYQLTIDVFIVKPELVELLREVINAEIEEFEEEIVTEKKRVHEDAICSFCKVKLVYPAYVVYRRGNKIVKQSEPIGIFCLNNTIGKLNDLVIEISVRYENIIEVEEGLKEQKDTKTEKMAVDNHAVIFCKDKKFQLGLFI